MMDDFIEQKVANYRVKLYSKYLELQKKDEYKLYKRREQMFNRFLGVKKIEQGNA